MEHLTSQNNSSRPAASTPWEARELVEFTAQRSAYYAAHPHAGPPGTPQQLLTLPALHDQMHFQASAIIALVERYGEQSGLSIWQPKVANNVTVVHENEIDLPVHLVSSAVKIGQYLLAGKGACYYDGTGLSMTLADPWLVSSFFQDPFFPVSEKFKSVLKDCTLLGPGVLGLNAEALGVHSLELPWADLPGLIGQDRAEAFLSRERALVGNKTSLLVSVGIESDLDPRTERGRRVITEAVLEAFTEPPADLTLVLLREGSAPGNALDAATTFQLPILEILTEDTSPSEKSYPVARMQYHTPLTFSPQETAASNVVSQFEAVATKARAVMTVRGSVHFDYLANVLSNRHYSPTGFHSLELRLEEQYKVDRTGKSDRIVFA